MPTEFYGPTQDRISKIMFQEFTWFTKPKTNTWTKLIIFVFRTTIINHQSNTNIIIMMPLFVLGFVSDNYQFENIYFAICCLNNQLKLENPH